MTKPKLWTCGDCGCQYRLKVTKCQHYYDDYLGVRGVKNVDEAIAKAIKGYMYQFDRAMWTLVPNPMYYRMIDGTLEVRK
jgi:hypothetical protein